MALNLIKLCVGCDTVEALLEWRAQSRLVGKPWILRTRQTPKRGAELVDGGSLYRVYKGVILSRQRILSVETVEAGAARRCEITLAEAVILTLPTPRRPFQGWRYLQPTDTPQDLGEAGQDASLPPQLARQLREIGAW